MNDTLRRRFASGTLLLSSLLLFGVAFNPGVVRVFGALNLWDTPQALPDLDARVGSIAPSADQLQAVQSLGAKAEWNRFGTVHTMLKYGGFLATGLSGEPVAAAREWIRANRGLFRLSDQGVTDLELVSDGPMAFSASHAVLFRQRFGGLPATQDGLINIGISNGNVFHVWSSSAGDQAAPGAATLSPVEAWIKAAANVNRIVALPDVTSAELDKQNNWTVLKVAGFPEVQQVRLTALPTPLNGVRPAYEANVLYNLGHINEAYTVFVDAQTGDILHRANRVAWAARATDAPVTSVFNGSYDPHIFPCASARHHFTVPGGQARIVVQVSAAVPTNDLSVTLLFGPDPTPVALVTEDTGSSSEVLTYSPNGGVPAGEYQVQICQTPNTMGVPQMAPFAYAGTFTYDDSPIPNAGVPYPPKWKYFRSTPPLDYSTVDIRITGCWEAAPGGAPIAACQQSLMNLASRAPWDYVFRSGTFTSTTRVNNAQTSEAWGSPLTPAENYSPVSATRDYIYPWANNWKTSGATGKGCDPTVLKHTAGVMPDADIDAATVQLFVTHNRFHDFSYFLGFTEQNSNLQLENLGNTAPNRENDPEIGNVQAGAISGGPNGMYTGRDNANQRTLQDGVPGITNQYLFQPIAAALYTPCVDGDMDVGIVGHEYTHAISNRMVGGPDAGLSGAQAIAMGESWSDLNAGEYLFENNLVPISDEDPTAVGIYATNNKKIAIRNYSLAINPLNYSNVGYDTPGPEEHSDGEIWNGTNWDVRQALINKYDAEYPYTDTARQKGCADGKFAPETCPGNRRWLQLMYDAFLLQPAATSMLDARDAMLAADVARFGGANQVEIWRAFAKRGMGGDAYSNGSSDNAPIPNFDSPVEANEATITFAAVASDEGNAPITNAKIIVGQFQARSRHIADTDPATTVDNSTSTTRRQTLNRSNSAKFVPGTYDFIVQAPGYGIQRFSRTFGAGQTATVTFAMPTNYASMSKGATVTTTATDAADIAAKNNLIDDTEDTGARLGTTAPVAGKSMTVDLPGTAPLTVRSVNVSAAAGPMNAGRFTGIRKFEIRTCNGACLNPVTDFTNVAYTSPDDAFPGDVPRPLQPNLNMRSFAIPPTQATHVQLRVLNTQCTGQPRFLGDQDDDPFNNSDCASSPSGAIARATELQVFATSGAPVPAGLVSRKVHNGTPYDISLPVSGRPGTECRAGGPSGDHQLIITFPTPISYDAVAISPATTKTGQMNGPAMLSAGGTNLTVNLTNVTNEQILTVTITGVNNGATVGDLAIPVGILLGDSNGDGSVNSGDAQQTRTRSGNLVSAAIARSDVNLDGTVNSGDSAIVRGRSGTTILP